MKVSIEHLFQFSQHYPTVAGWIYNEFWSDKPNYSAKKMEDRLRLATQADSIPLSLLALENDRPVGTVNLVENDDEKRPHLSPWLAALVVIPEFRSRGIGSQLVEATKTHAIRLGYQQLYLGTDNPGFYERLEATVFETQADSDIVIMKLVL